MAGLTAGYFPATYFTHDYWQLSNQYWTEYGTTPTQHHAVWVTKRRLSPNLLRIIKKYLEVKVNKT